MIEYNGYKIESDGTYGYKNIKPIGRGSVPISLRGDYTTVRLAQMAIDSEINKKEVINAEAVVSV